MGPKLLPLRAESRYNTSQRAPHEWVKMTKVENSQFCTNTAGHHQFGNHYIINSHKIKLPCPSFPCFFGKKAGKTPQKTRIFYPTETQKSLERREKRSKKQGNPRKEKKQGIPKKTRKGRTEYVTHYST